MERLEPRRPMSTYEAPAPSPEEGTVKPNELPQLALFDEFLPSPPPPVPSVESMALSTMTGDFVNLTNGRGMWEGTLVQLEESDFLAIRRILANNIRRKLDALAPKRQRRSPKPKGRKKGA